jgi:hypothetical protein
VGGLAQVRRAGFGVQVGPQRLDHLVACQAMPVRQGEQLHELGGAPPRPPMRRDLVAADGDPEPAEQVDADAAPPRFRSHRSRAPGSPYPSEERFGNARPPGWQLPEDEEEP